MKDKIKISLMLSIASAFLSLLIIYIFKPKNLVIIDVNNKKNIDWKNSVLISSVVGLCFFSIYWCVINETPKKSQKVFHFSY